MDQPRSPLVQLLGHHLTLDLIEELTDWLGEPPTPQQIVDQVRMAIRKWIAPCPDPDDDDDAAGMPADVDGWPQLTYRTVTIEGEDC